MSEKSFDGIKQVYVFGWSEHMEAYTRYDVALAHERQTGDRFHAVPVMDGEFGAWSELDPFTFPEPEDDADE